MAKQVKEQLKIGLPAELRAKLEAATSRSGLSLAEEIRSRVERTFEQDGVDKPTRDLAAYVENLDVFVRLQTGKNWHAHAAAHWVMRTGIIAYLQRVRPEGDRTFKPGELPSALIVATDDPEAMGIGLESIIFHMPARDEERLRAMHEETVREMLRLHPELEHLRPSDVPARRAGRRKQEQKS